MILVEDTRGGEVEARSNPYELAGLEEGDVEGMMGRDYGNWGEPAKSLQPRSFGMKTKTKKMLSSASHASSVEESDDEEEESVTRAAPRSAKKKLTSTVGKIRSFSGKHKAVRLALKKAVPPPEEKT